MRSAAVCWCGLLLVGLVSSEKGLSQVQAGAAVGDRVRYWDAAGQGAIRASLMRVGNDTLTFKLTNDSVVYVPRAQITRLDVSTGRYRSATLGAAFGLGGGALVGLIGGSLQSAQKPSAFALPAGILGAVAGALIGVPRDEWTTVPVLASGTSIVASIGPRYRLTFGDGARSTTAIGLLHSADSVSVVLRGDQVAAFTTVPRSAIRTSEVSVGTDRHRKAGFLLGFLGGAALGAGISALSQRQKPPGDDYRGLNVLIGGVLGALGGSVIGAIIGSHVSTEFWQDADLPARRAPP